MRLISYAKTNGKIYVSIFGISWFWLVGATFIAEIPAFTKDVLFANEHVVTFFFALFSIGIALGSLGCNWLVKGRVDATYVPLGALGMAIFTLDLYFTSRYANPLPASELVTLTQFLQSGIGIRITIDLLLMAASGGLYTVPLYAMVQYLSDDKHRARLIASNNIINAIFMVVAAAVTMLMLRLGLSVSQVFLLLAIANGLVAIYICRLLPDALIKAALTWIFKSVYRVKVVGLENYYNAGNRVVIVANHTSFLDAALLATFLPDKLTYAIDVFAARKWWIKLFLCVVDAHPINPSNPMALKSIIDVVRQDKRCVIFPEGRLTVTGALMKIYKALV